jgi:hypothetical protein
LNLLAKYIVCITLVGSAGLGCSRNNLPPLTESYRKTDKLPFGAFIAYKGFESEFKNYWINTMDQPFDRSWLEMKNDRSFASKYSLYFLVTKNLILREEEANAMMQFVEAGNDLFVSAEYVDPDLLEALHCTIDGRGEIVSEASGKMDDTFVSMYYGNDFQSQKYGYYYFPFSAFISSYDSSVTRVLGVNEQNLPDYIVLFHGKGRFYLHVAPRAFSNYFLLTKNNYQYFEYVTAYLRFDPQYVYWDEYYKNISALDFNNNAGRRRNKNEFSSLNVIRQHASLWWAFCIGMSGILLFMIFNTKRKQRLIKIIKPHANTTVAFAETIGRLYFEQKNNKNIADKMITYFYEYLRRKYFINASSVDGYFINNLSGKSGISLTEIKQLFETIQKIKMQDEVSDEELLELNAGIEKFKNNTDGRKQL